MIENLNGRQNGKTETQGKIYRDYLELQKRREVERLLQEYQKRIGEAYWSTASISYSEGMGGEYGYSIIVKPCDAHCRTEVYGPFTLKELHDKLRSLTQETPTNDE